MEPQRSHPNLAAGLKPIEADLARIAALQDQAALQKELAWLHLYSVPAIFTFTSGDDDKNSTQVIAQIRQGGLGLPDRDYYFTQDERTQKIREEYLKHIVAILRLAGDDETTATASAKTVMAIETKLADASFTAVELRDSEKKYNKMSPEKLTKLAPEKENFNFYGATLTGAKEQQPRWRRVKEVIDGLLGEALGELFVAKKFSSKAKTRAREMVDNLIAAYRERIMNLEWMDETTRQAALHKLATKSFFPPGFCSRRSSTRTPTMR